MIVEVVFWCVDWLINFCSTSNCFLLNGPDSGLICPFFLQFSVLADWVPYAGLPEALMKAGAVYKYDLSLPIEKMYDLVEEMRTRLGALAKVVAFGHLGDGNLHLNISAPQYEEKILAQIEPFVYEWTSKHRGSISAEHGLGLMKATEIFYSKSTNTVQLMAFIKKLLDPRGILNPYKVLPHSLSS
ncbi:D-2-hydroxyglutarate dehydrogenase [Morus notabilis]|uniref:D-2-hydroxyglutarate dehydrogenase n=1 Tax=Morus notabilis TaxID=981085 RepID=W9SSN2_9ROSA|nr:D-2-hydroxyglutarate dehydrogenase [Morus notabilis]